MAKIKKGKTSAIRVVDLDKALRGLSVATAKVKGANHKGMIKGGLLIQRESQRLVPVDTGNLRSSAFTIWNNPVAKGRGTMKGVRVLKGISIKESQSSNARQRNIVANEQGQLNARPAPTVEVGYGAFYAVYVHENMEAAHKGSRQAKFLSLAISQNTRRIFKVIKDEADKEIAKSVAKGLRLK